LTDDQVYNNIQNTEILLQLLFQLHWQKQGKK
jgi:hypothetical protein